MTTVIKMNIKISEDIDKYKLAANITVYHILSKVILQRIFITNFCGLVVMFEMDILTFMYLV